MAASLAPAVAFEGIKPKDQYPIEVVKAVEKAFDSPLTEGEAELVRQYPELAAVTPDLAASTTESFTVATPSAQARQAENCSEGMSTHHSKTLLGQTFYDMTTTVAFCWDGAYVNWVGDPQTSFANVSPTANVEGEHEKIAAPGQPGHAKHTWRVKNEIPVWGTINIKYPFNEFFLDAGGNVRTNSGE